MSTCKKCFYFLPADQIKPDGLCMKCYYNGNAILGLRNEAQEAEKLLEKKVK